MSKNSQNIIIPIELIEKLKVIDGTDKVAIMDLLFYTVDYVSDNLRNFELFVNETNVSRMCNFIAIKMFPDHEKTRFLADIDTEQKLEGENIVHASSWYVFGEVVRLLLTICECYMEESLGKQFFAIRTFAEETGIWKYDGWE